MRLSWALVHSRQTEDVHRGIAMLECKQKYKTISLSLSTHAHIHGFPSVTNTHFCSFTGQHYQPFETEREALSSSCGLL